MVRKFKRLAVMPPRKNEKFWKWAIMAGKYSIGSLLLGYFWSYGAKLSNGTPQPLQVIIIDNGTSAVSPSVSPQRSPKYT
jgi:hypothetical protein